MDKTILKHPIITEKATAMSAFGKYLFLVDDCANAPQIKKAMKLAYNVDVVRVNLINAKSKARRLRSTYGVKPGYKKAIVTLKEGQKLDVLPH